ncbi:MAG TPA: DUF1028 domain-containing protein [Actinomycetota bacterium]
MTFSIAGFDPANGDLGVAVASRFPCVGAVVPWARAGVGAVATQAWANTSFGPDGLGLLRQGMSAAEVLDALVEADDGRDDRQVGAVDARGGAATFTGTSCVDWAGGRTGDHVAAQGNILVGAEVVDAMLDAYVGEEGDLSDRLLAALLAGDRAGGDRRGRQSAALLVVREAGGYEGRNDRYIDLRVDDHPDAPAELARLFGVWDDTMLVRRDPLLEATPELVADLQRRLAKLGYAEGPVTGSYDDATREALAAWAGWVNLEMRLRDDQLISQHLVRELRDVTPEIDPADA